ncbi:hypothetical protein JL721_9120 [Aureococcus anophagefferens]|nr:hypothetical protein JL721_9120 [Aureococcus anophagefferens]
MAFGEATVREERAFWSTTGMYPQSAFVNLEAATRLLELDLVCCPDVLTVSVAIHAADGTWEDVATVTFDDAGRPQSDVRRKLSFANKNVVCSKIKLSIDRSAADFYCQVRAPPRRAGLRVAPRAPRRRPRGA